MGKRFLPSIKNEFQSQLESIRGEIKTLSTKCIDIEKSQNFMSRKFENFKESLQTTKKRHVLKGETSKLGAVRYCNRNRLSSCCQGRPCKCAVFKALPRGCMNLSASAFPCGQYGVENSGLIPSVSRYLRYSSPLNGGPLSDFTMLGMPCVAKILSNFGITVDALVDRTISTSGYLEYRSITTSKYSPVGNGP